MEDGEIAKLAKNFDEIVVCTTEREVDNQIADQAQSLAVKVFRGSLEDKLERWNGAAKEYGIDYIVTFDGDDLFCEPILLDMAADQIREGEYDLRCVYLCFHCKGIGESLWDKGLYGYRNDVDVF